MFPLLYYENALISNTFHFSTQEQFLLINFLPVWTLSAQNLVQ
jgi:hypothetical protein